MATEVSSESSIIPKKKVSLIYWSIHNFWRRQWQLTLVLLPGKSHGRRSLVGCNPWGCRVGHDWVTSLSLFTFMHWRRKWQPTPVFLPGESQGRGSLVGCSPWGCTESDTTEVTQQQQQQQQQLCCSRWRCEETDRMRNLKSGSSGFECRLLPVSSLTWKNLKEKLTASDLQILRCPYKAAVTNQWCDLWPPFSKAHGPQ